ncbi:GvpL/GvpF family gas vesicle protein [Streptomyces sp. NPDC047000]|uniref:GvpL/GvpF family gas vesicle protein n=1 Tax=Streptomyces sp. NPDC047000 TaxID=3155474 RepID=UPI0033CBF050
MNTYVYGIVARSRPALPEGLSGVGSPPRPVRVLAEGELAALVSDAPEDLRPKRRELLAHQNVLAEAGAGGCVLPMRFGSAAPDDSAVTAVLAERSAHYAERLAALDGKAEYNVKAAHVEDAVLQLVVSENAGVRELAEAQRQSGGGSYEERLHLGEMIADAVKSREAVDAADLRTALEHVTSAIAAGPESTGWLANVSVLVDRDAAGDFLAVVDELRQERPHLDVRVNGPLPPYSFVEPGPAEPAAPSGG